MTPYLQFASIDKRFPGVHALADVSFGVGEGSVHALMGENGAGKSTLLKILAGAYRPDGGALRLAGDARRFRSTVDAIDAGVAVIYQELHLAPELSVAENLLLGHLPGRGGWVDRGAMTRRAREVLQWLGEEGIDAGTKVRRLSLGQRQMIEIGKALARDAKVIAFDEPTSSLSARETDRLFAVVRRLRDEGKVVLYVSHRMEEIYEICDAATVLRDGRHVATFDRLEGVSRDLLVQKMVGRAIEDIYRYAPRPNGDVVLDVKALQGPGVTAPASFDVRGGEVVGFFGLVGAGRTELMKLIGGAIPSTGGTVCVDGHAVVSRQPLDALRQGIVLCPEDRKREGIVPVRSVRENLNLPARRRLARGGFWIDENREREHADGYVKRLRIKTASPREAIRNLSGGNQQKVILTRALADGVRVILLDEPTRGIDVGAKSEIYSIIYALAASGAAVVVVSSELPEVLGISDRVCVMRQGRIVGQLPRGALDSESVLRLALPVGEMTGNASDDLEGGSPCRRRHGVTPSN